MFETSVNPTMADGSSSVILLPHILCENALGKWSLKTDFSILKIHLHRQSDRPEWIRTIKVLGTVLPGKAYVFLP